MLKLKKKSVGYPKEDFFAVKVSNSKNNSNIREKQTDRKYYT